MTTRLPVDQRRAQLVEAALAIAAEEGIAAVTVRRVAERAQVALGVVHYCFADKDALVVALAERIVDDLGAAAAAALRFDDDEPPGDLATALRCAVHGLWDLVERAPAEQLLTYEITTFALRTPGLAHVAARQYEVSHRVVESVLVAAAQAAGAQWRRPVAEVAAEVLALVDGVTLRWLVDRDGAAAKARLTTMAEQVAPNARPVRRRLRAVASVEGAEGTA
ncbi:MAG: TetR/AcrR family transcriptional regulator [Jatrophihabitans sp.]|uniref:TetR/AcrR family transcriptional regulator n=1 Tax=Jatrophihabitans sp. TaxID=1932789 RepID=UPI003F7E196B